jgi:DNA-binding transcriptional MocR family regulator
LSDETRVDHPFGIVPLGVLECSNSALRVYVILAERANKAGTCFPGYESIAADIGVSVSTVQRAVRELVAAGWVTKVRRQTSNLYLVHRFQVVTDDRVEIPGGHSSDTLQVVTALTTEPDPVTRPTKKNAPDPFTASFQELWEAYPRRVNNQNRDGGFKAYRRRVKAGDVTEADALTAAKRYAATSPEPRFVMMCSTFFGRDERWREYLGEDAGGTFVDDADRLAAENDWMVSSL